MLLYLVHLALKLLDGKRRSVFQKSYRLADRLVIFLFGNFAAAQTAAETAQGLAETAQSGAEIARSAAEIAQAGAETAQTAAETAQGKAEDAQAGAEAAQAAAEAAQAAAEEAAASVNIDTEMSTTSEHAVQNKVITAALGGKVDKVSGKQLSTEDYTSAEKTKLAGIAAGAEVNVQADWTQTSTTADDYIKNKPANLVQDASYVHTDNNYTTADKTKLAGIPADADKTVIDDTLTQTGEAADAKATGDAIATLNSALSSLQSVTEIIDTASGAIASFPDGSGLPMRSLVAQINPVQDLHGYDAPWPAGGGSNLFKFPYQPLRITLQVEPLILNVSAGHIECCCIGSTLFLFQQKCTVCSTHKTICAGNHIIGIICLLFAGMMHQY